MSIGNIRKCRLNYKALGIYIYKSSMVSTKGILCFTHTCGSTNFNNIYNGGGWLS